MSESADDGGKNDDSEDIYGDIGDFHIDRELAKLEESNKAYREDVANLSEKLRILTEKCSKLEATNDVLVTNISILLKTARTEVERKEGLIAELRKQVDEVSSRSRHRNNRKHNDGLYVCESCARLRSKCEKSKSSDDGRKQSSRQESQDSCDAKESETIANDENDQNKYKSTKREDSHDGGGRSRRSPRQSERRDSRRRESSRSRRRYSADRRRDGRRSRERSRERRKRSPTRETRRRSGRSKSGRSRNKDESQERESRRKRRARDSGESKGERGRSAAAEEVPAKKLRLEEYQLRRSKESEVPREQASREAEAANGGTLTSVTEDCGGKVEEEEEAAEEEEEGECPVAWGTSFAKAVKKPPKTLYSMRMEAKMKQQLKEEKEEGEITEEEEEGDGKNVGLAAKDPEDEIQEFSPLKNNYKLLEISPAKGDASKQHILEYYSLKPNPPQHSIDPEIFDFSFTMPITPGKDLLGHRDGSDASDQLKIEEDEEDSDKAYCIRTRSRAREGKTPEEAKRKTNVESGRSRGFSASKRKRRTTSVDDEEEEEEEDEEESKTDGPKDVLDEDLSLSNSSEARGHIVETPTGPKATRTAKRSTLSGTEESDVDIVADGNSTDSGEYSDSGASAFVDLL